MIQRKTFKVACVTLLILVLIFTPLDRKQESFNGEPLENSFKHYISVRDFFEADGWRVNWDQQANIATIKYNAHVIELLPNSQTAYIDKQILQFEKSTQIVNGKLVIAPSCITRILEQIQTGNSNLSVEQLWSKTVAVHLKDKLWLDDNIYDAGHYLMVPMHAAFMLDKVEWQQQFADQFKNFMENKQDISDGLGNQLHYYYLMSRFMVLARDSGKSNLIPEGMADYLYARTINIFYYEPAWQWEHSDFSSMKERILWKLNTQNPKQSYYRAIIDQELFVFAIAADLSNYYRDKDNKKTQQLTDILNIAQRVYKQESNLKSDGTWVFQPGVWTEHPDYLYAGNEHKIIRLSEKPVKGIAMDTSHSHRFPLWLTSLAEAYSSDSDERKYYDKLRVGLAKQFISKVLVEPTDDFPGYRTTNFMDGRNGIFRWNYATQGSDNGYGPYELSGTMYLGWWTFLDLDSSKINSVYKEISRQFPLSDDVIKLCVGPGTSRERNSLINGSNAYVNGYIKLICILAGKI